MDSNSEDGEYQNLEHAFQHDAAQYRVSYPHGRNTKQVSWVARCNAQRYFCILERHCYLHFFIYRGIMIKTRSSTKRGMLFMFCVYMTASALCDLAFYRIFCTIHPTQVSSESLWQQPRQSEASSVL